MFTVSRPTFTSDSLTDMKPSDFPDILICPDQAFQVEELERLGYQFSYYYSIGQASHGWGWRGQANQTELNVSQIYDRISSIKTSQDCPHLVAQFREDGRIREVGLKLRLTRVTYPRGRCCRAVKPEIGTWKGFYNIYNKRALNTLYISFLKILSFFYSLD